MDFVMIDMTAIRMIESFGFDCSFVVLSKFSGEFLAVENAGQ